MMSFGATFHNTDKDDPFVNDTPNIYDNGMFKVFMPIEKEQSQTRDKFNSDYLNQESISRKEELERLTSELISGNPIKSDDILFDKDFQPLDSKKLEDDEFRDKWLDDISNEDPEKS